MEYIAVGAEYSGFFGLWVGSPLTLFFSFGSSILFFSPVSFIGFCREHACLAATWLYIYIACSFLWLRPLYSSELSFAVHLLLLGRTVHMEWNSDCLSTEVPRSPWTCYAFHCFRGPLQDYMLQTCFFYPTYMHGGKKKGGRLLLCLFALAVLKEFFTCLTECNFFTCLYYLGVTYACMEEQWFPSSKIWKAFPVPPVLKTFLVPSRPGSVMFCTSCLWFHTRFKLNLRWETTFFFLVR